MMEEEKESGEKPLRKKQEKERLADSEEELIAEQVSKASKPLEEPPPAVPEIPEEDVVSKAMEELETEEFEKTDLQELAREPPVPVKELEPMRVIEAALFMSSKPLSTSDFSGVTGIAAPGHLLELVKKLQKTFDESGSSICVVEEDGKFVMRLRHVYAGKVQQYAQDAEVSSGALRILAFISQHEGIEQSRVVKTLGSTVYQHVKELVKDGFLEAKKSGRTKTLRTTKKFKDYFSE